MRVIQSQLTEKERQENQRRRREKVVIIFIAILFLIEFTLRCASFASQFYTE